MWRIQFWLLAWIELAETLIKIFTFYTVVPNWYFKIMSIITIRKVKKRINNERSTVR